MTQILFTWIESDCTLRVGHEDTKTLVFITTCSFASLCLILSGKENKDLQEKGTQGKNNKMFAN